MVLPGGSETILLVEDDDSMRKEDKPSCGVIVWKFFKRTINITEYRNGKDDVNPAKNRTLGGITDH
jgi:hypothetical protein